MEAIQKQPGLFEHFPIHKGYIYKPTPQRTFCHCTVCGKEGTPFFTAISYFMNHFDNPFEPVKTWIKCNYCGNLFTQKFPETFLKLSEHHELLLPESTPPPTIYPHIATLHQHSPERCIFGVTFSIN